MSPRRSLPGRNRRIYVGSDPVSRFGHYTDSIAAVDITDIPNIPSEPPFSLPVPAQNHDRKASAQKGTILDCEDCSKDLPEGGDAPTPLENTVDVEIKMRTLEHRMREASSVRSFLVWFNDWLRLARQLDPAKHRAALIRCCGKGYAVGDEGPLLTYRILKRLSRSNWSLRDIARWLSRPAVPLPSPGSREGRRFLTFLRVQLERLSQSHDNPGAAGGHPFATLYQKMAAPLLDAESLVDQKTSRLLYWARWQRLLVNHRSSMEGSAFQSLEWIANVLTDANTHYSQTRTVPEKVQNRLSQLVDSDCLDATSLRHVWNLLPAQTPALDDPQSKAVGTGVHFLYAKHDDRVRLANVEFQNILDRARSAGVLPPAYWNETVDAPSPRRVEIIHQLAHCYSINHTMSSTSKFRAVQKLQRYLDSYDLPIQPLFTKALVRICLGESMTKSQFVTSSTMDWLLGLVNKVEGPEVAKSIEHQVWLWRGELIDKANRVTKGLKGPGAGATRARVNTLKRLGLLP